MRNPYQDDSYISYEQAIKIIAIERGISITLVRRILQLFFGKHGVRYYVNKNIEFKIHNLGTFKNTHKATMLAKRKNKATALAMKAFRQQAKNKLRN